MSGGAGSRSGSPRMLAAATGLHVERLLGWCAAFASVIALELASQGNAPGPRREALLRLAAQAPPD